VHGVTAPQLVCLQTLEEHGSLTTSAVAERIHLSPSTVIGILDRLEAKGLITRERDLKDRRLVRATLTESGTALIQQAPSPLQDTLAEAMNDLPEAEQAMIVQSLERIVELMEVKHIPAAPILETGPLDAKAKPSEPPTGGDKEVR
jgi:DNA-binding MarR family transcriptional regulator